MTRGRKTRAVFLLGSCLSAILFSARLSALEEDRSRVSIALAGGLAVPMGPAEFSRDYKQGPNFGGRVRYDISEHWTMAGSFASQTFNLKTDVSKKLNTQPLILMTLYSPIRTYRWNPYLALGAGLSRNRREVFAVEQEWTKLTGAAGLGMEFNVSRLNTFSLEALYRYFGGAGGGEKDFQTATVSALISFYLPYSWIPDKPKKPLLPLVVAETPAAAAQQEQALQAQEELNKVQQDILDKRLPSILFETGKAFLLSTSAETLDIVGTILKRYPQFSVRVEGHTDDVGSDLDNMLLSQSRAEAVRRYLVENFQIAGDKISALGFGETQPLADNASEEGRAKNRRVEFKIIQ